MTDVTIDIPGVAYEWNHAGSPGGVVGDGISSATDSGYIYFGNDGGNGGTWGWGLFVKFPATTLLGTLVSTALVVRLRGPDSRVVSASQIAFGGANPLNFRISMLMTHRSGPATPPDYGYVDEAFWMLDRSQDAAFTDYLQPLKYPAGDPVISNPYVFDPTWPEYVTQDQIETGKVEYNPGGGFYLAGSYVGTVTHPGAFTDNLEFSYIALRVTYTPYVPVLTAVPKDLRRRFTGV